MIYPIITVICFAILIWVACNREKEIEHKGYLSGFNKGLEYGLRQTIVQTFETIEEIENDEINYKQLVESILN